MNTPLSSHDTPATTVESDASKTELAYGSGSMVRASIMVPVNLICANRDENEKRIVSADIQSDFNVMGVDFWDVSLHFIPIRRKESKNVTRLNLSHALE